MDPNEENSNDNSVYNNKNPEKLSSKDIFQNESRKEEIKLEQIFQKLQGGYPLSKDEIEIIEKSSLLGSEQKENILESYANIQEEIKLQKNIESVSKKIQKGEEISKDEKNLIEKFSYQQSLSEPEHKQFLEKSKAFKKSGGKKIIHFTDPHLQIEDLESRMRQILLLNDFNPKEDIFVNTGDILPDLLDQRQNGVDTFNPKRIALEGKLNNKESQEFIEDMDNFMKYFGLSLADLETNLSSLGQGGEQLYNNFYFGLLMHSEPDNLDENEIIKYRELRENVHKNLRKAIRGHAKKNYSEIKRIFEENGLNSSNTILTPGNHDVEEIMFEELSDYVIRPGSIKNINGTRFGNMISGSTGEVLGPYLSDEFAWKDIRKNPKTISDTKSFKALKQRLNDAGIENIDDMKISQYISFAKRKSAMGISDSALVKYFNSHIKPEFDHTIDRISKEIPTINPNDVDFYVGHGDPTSQYAGAEEKFIHQFLKNSKKPYLHGHIHENSSHMHDGVYYINPGIGQSMNHGIYSIDKKNEVKDIMFAQLNPLTRRPEFSRYSLDSLVSKTENYK